MSKILLAYSARHSEVVTFTGAIVSYFQSLAANGVIYGFIGLALTKGCKFLCTVNKQLHDFLQLIL